VLARDGVRRVVVGGEDQTLASVVSE
jgi:hypothetical protein